MKNGNFKNALLGIALAIAASYLYIVVFFVFLVGARGWSVVLTVIPFVLLFYTSWIVLPLGAALGMLVPRIAYGKSRRMAAFHGAALGAAAGLISAACLISAYDLLWEGRLVVLTAGAYTALWVGAYAFFRAEGQSLYR